VAEPLLATPGLVLRELPGLRLTALHGPADLLPGLPDRPASATLAHGCVLWVAPGQWLLLGAPPAALPATHWTDLTGSRSLFELAGPRAREALATLLPIDLHPREFGAEAAAATIAAHIPLLVWRAGEAFRLACARSYGQALAEVLLVAARGRDAATPAAGS